MARVLACITFICLPLWAVIVNAAPEVTSKTATMRIVLKVPARAEMRALEHALPLKQQVPTQLCIGHIPAEQYQVVITGTGRAQTEVVEGRAGYYCLPPSITENAGSVTIVAQ